MRNSFCKLTGHPLLFNVVLLLLVMNSHREIAADETPKAGEKTSETPTAVSQKPDVAVEMTAGGIGRYVVNRWGIAQGLFTNRRDQPVNSLAVITPAGGGGLQYARQLQLPARMSFESAWPVWVSSDPVQGAVDFPYLFFPDGKDDGVIRHQKNEKQIPSYSGMTQKGPDGLCGLLDESSLDKERDPSMPHQTMSVMRYVSSGQQAVVTILSTELTSNPECLDPLDQLIISDSQLSQLPQACEIIRLWVLRGGRLLIQMDRCGPEVVEALLGESLPITIVGESTTNTLTLDINPDYSTRQYPIRQVTREFVEPVHFLRIQPDAGEVIWSIEGWPALIRMPVGRGIVLVSALPASAYIEPAETSSRDTPSHTMIPSSRRMMDTMFSDAPEPLIQMPAASSAAATMVGYEIPSRRMAMLLLAIFPCCLIVAGFQLQRRAHGEKLIILLPVLAVLAAIPAVVMALQIRSVAPPTMIETSVMHTSPGFTNIPNDGFATAYVPSPIELKPSSSEGAKIVVRPEADNADYRRMTWYGPAENSWTNLKQPAGLRTLSFASTQKVKSAWRAIATFDESGLTGQLQIDEEPAPTDLMLLGVNHENLALQIQQDGTFRGDSSDRLAAGQFYRTTYLSDEQRLRSDLMKSALHDSSSLLLSGFPEQASLLFWRNVEQSPLEFAGDAFQLQKSTMVVMPLELTAPAAGQRIVIPSALLPYQSINTATGGLSSVYSNVGRNWGPYEDAAEVLLEFRIPEVCLPFDTDSAEVTILIRAGSRTVTFESGARENLKSVSQLSSPLGSQTITIPTDMIRETCRNGRLFLQIRVSALEESMQASELSGEQDDSWRIEHVLLSLHGRRQP